MTLLIMTLPIMTLLIMTLPIMTLLIMTLLIMTIPKTIKKLLLVKKPVREGAKHGAVPYTIVIEYTATFFFLKLFDPILPIRNAIKF
jgi:hypothetical protein